MVVGMRRLTITRAGIGWGAFAVFLVVLLMTGQLFRTPLSDTERATLAARYSNPAYTDSRLREIADTADPDTQALLNAELARRGAK